MKDDYDRSVERLARSEDQRAKLNGFGTTKQGRALARRYCERGSLTLSVPTVLLAAPSPSGGLYGASRTTIWPSACWSPALAFAPTTLLALTAMA